jgi:microcystin-dependent protein
MANPYLGEIRIVAFNFAPQGWAMCNGQLLPINQNTALFSILGTTYGGNGTTTFALPNLQSQVPIFWGQGTGLSNQYTLGQTGGTENVTLEPSQLPSHSHSANANSAGVNAATPGANFWGNSQQSNYAAATDGTTLAPGTVSPAGGGQPFQRLRPFLVLNFVIAMQGIFPSRN